MRLIIAFVVALLAAPAADAGCRRHEPDELLGLIRVSGFLSDVADDPDNPDPHAATVSASGYATVYVGMPSVKPQQDSLFRARITNTSPTYDLELYEVLFAEGGQGLVDLDEYLIDGTATGDPLTVPPGEWAIFGATLPAGTASDPVEIEAVWEILTVDGLARFEAIDWVECDATGPGSYGAAAFPALSSATFARGECVQLLSGSRYFGGTDMIDLGQSLAVIMSDSFFVVFNMDPDSSPPPGPAFVLENDRFAIAYQPGFVESWVHTASGLLHVVAPTGADPRRVDVYVGESQGGVVLSIFMDGQLVAFEGGPGEALVAPSDPTTVGAIPAGYGYAGHLGPMWSGSGANPVDVIQCIAAALRLDEELDFHPQIFEVDDR